MFYQNFLRLKSTVKQNECGFDFFTISGLDFGTQWYYLCRIIVN